MTRRVFLHVGTPKSGTTYLQQRLMANHARLREQGILWPGPKWYFQTLAVDDLRNVRPGEQPSADGAWTDLVHRIDSFDGDTALVSMEWMTFLNTHHRQIVMDALGGYDLHIVITARDLLRQVVSQWQQIMRNMRAVPLERYVREIRAEDNKTWSCRNFWWQHDIVRLVDDWSGLVGADHVHLVTVPQSGADPEELWRRFGSVVGFDGGDFVEGERTNPSTGVVSTELMRRLCQVAREEDMDRETFERIMRARLSVEILTRWRKDEGPVTASEETDAWARERGGQMIDDLRARDFQLVGDLDELRPGRPLPGRLPTDVSDTELLEVAEKAMVALMIEVGGELVETRQELARTRRGRAAQAARRIPRVRRLVGRLRQRFGS